MKMFIIGFCFALVLLTLLAFGATQLPRSYSAVIVAKFINAPITDTPFLDVSQLSQLERDSISKLYAAGITSGTSSTTFSPHAKTALYQWFIFIGKGLMYYA